METPRGRGSWREQQGEGGYCTPAKLQRNQVVTTTKKAKAAPAVKVVTYGCPLGSWPSATLPVVGWLKTTSCMPLATCHMPPLAAAAWKVVHPARMRSSGSQVSMETFFVAKFRWCHKMPQHAVARKQFLARFQRQRYAPKTQGPR